MASNTLRHAAQVRVGRLFRSPILAFIARSRGAAIGELDGMAEATPMRSLSSPVPHRAVVHLWEQLLCITQR
jgi:hypothetical protein